MRSISLLILAAVLLAACSSNPTAPAMHDPSVLISNPGSATAIFTWLTPGTITRVDTVTFNGARFVWAEGGVRTDTVRPGTTFCSRFTSSDTLASWEVSLFLVPGDSTQSWSEAAYYPAWFAARTDSAWTATVLGSQQANYAIQVRPSAAPC